MPQPRSTASTKRDRTISAQVQYLYALLGQRSCSGLRGGLAALRAEYEQAFKYTGKV